MANERDLELLDDYLANRMDEGNRAAFEQKLKADPDLQQEFTMQKTVIEGIKSARIAELKSMLNNVPVPPAGNALASKIFMAAAVTLVVAAAAYWLTRDHDIDTPATKPGGEVVEEIAPENAPVPAPESSATAAEPETPAQRQAETVPAPDARPRAAERTDKNQTSAGTEHSKPSLAKRPEPLSAPAARNSESKKTQPSADPLAGEDSSRLLRDRTLTPVKGTVRFETQQGNERHNFHYQFRDGKLLLLGPFNAAACQVLEFNTAEQQRVLFLAYENRFYELAKTDGSIEPLTAVTDSLVIKELSRYMK